MEPDGSIDPSSRPVRTQPTQPFRLLGGMMVDKDVGSRSRVSCRIHWCKYTSGRDLCRQQKLKIFRETGRSPSSSTTQSNREFLSSSSSTPSFTFSRGDDIDRLAFAQAISPKSIRSLLPSNPQFEIRAPEGFLFFWREQQRGTFCSSNTS